MNIKKNYPDQFSHCPYFQTSCHTFVLKPRQSSEEGEILTEILERIELSFR